MPPMTWLALLHLVLHAAIPGAVSLPVQAPFTPFEKPKSSAKAGAEQQGYPHPCTRMVYLLSLRGRAAWIDGTDEANQRLRLWRKLDLNQEAATAKV